MIDLFSIKLNGEYDEIGAVPTIENGLFLCDTTGENYTRGYSYQITDGNAQRVETVTDYKIQQAIYPTIQSVCEWLNNWFKVPCNCKQVFLSGTLCSVCGRLGDYVSYITLHNDENGIYITFDNNALEDVFYIDGKTPEIIIKEMRVPQDFEKAISQMIYYDVFTRGTVDDLKSESIGNYSYSKEDVYIGTLAYPKALISGLEANYKRLRFVQ